MRFSVSSPSLRVTIRPCGPDSERPLAKVPQSRRSRTLVRGRARRKWIRIEHAEARRHRACRPQKAMNCQDLRHPMFSHPWPVNMADIKLDRRQR